MAPEGFETMALEGPRIVARGKDSRSAPRDQRAPSPRPEWAADGHTNLIIPIFALMNDRVAPYHSVRFRAPIIISG